MAAKIPHQELVAYSMLINCNMGWLAYDISKQPQGWWLPELLTILLYTVHSDNAGRLCSFYMTADYSNTECSRFHHSAKPPLKSPATADSWLPSPSPSGSTMASIEGSIGAFVHYPVRTSNTPVALALNKASADEVAQGKLELPASADIHITH